MKHRFSLPPPNGGTSVLDISATLPLAPGAVCFSSNLTTVGATR